MLPAEEDVNDEELAAAREIAERYAREVQQILAEAVSNAATRAELSDEQREQAESVITHAMESTRQLVKRLATPDR